MHNIFDIYMGL